MPLFKIKKYKYSGLLKLARIIAGPNAQLYIFDPTSRVEYDLNFNNSVPSEIEEKVLINLGKPLIQFKNIPLSEFNYIFDFSKGIKSNESDSKTKYSILRDGNSDLKWIVKSTDTKAQFLTFLQRNTTRAKLIYLMLKTIFIARLSHFTFTSFNLLNRKPLHFEQFDSASTSHYSISMGISGKMQKGVVCKHLTDGQAQYVKIAISAATKESIENELRNIKSLDYYNLSTIIHPSTTSESNGYGLSTNGILEGAIPSAEFGTIHARSIKEMIDKSLKFQKLSETRFWSGILYDLDTIKQRKDNRFDKIYKQLNYIKESILSNQYIYTSISHGDFTPWNASVKKNNLCVIDWENFNTDTPLLYDLYHFIFQSSTLTKNKDIKDIHKRMNKAIKQPKIRHLINQFNLNTNLYYQLYLLKHACQNVAQFLGQEVLSVAHLKMLKNWEDAISNMSFRKTGKNDRIEFLEILESFLKNKNYAWLKSSETSFLEISEQSDLDFAADKITLNLIKQYLKEHYLVKRVETFDQSFMTTFKIHFMNDAFLSIDVITNFVRKATQYLKVDLMLARTERLTSVKKPALHDDIAYAQYFYTLNDASVPLKYQAYFMTRMQADRNRMTTKSFISKGKLLSGGSLAKSFQFTMTKKKQLLSAIKDQNSLLKKIRLVFNYLNDKQKSFIHNKGKIITFSGVDGAGKTTVLTLVKSQLENKYRKNVVVLRHRPGILPILSSLTHGGKKKAEKRASVTLPRTGNNNSKMSSIFRFAYYFFDYLIGQLYVRIKYTYRGTTVIYDRYFFDFINDSKRSNITLNRDVIKWFYRFIDKPECNFFLYHEPAVILARKQELKLADIIKLNYDYHSLFNDLEQKSGGNYYKLKNEDLEESVSWIIKLITKAA